MAAILAENSYGKSRVRVSKIIRGADRHDFVELIVDTLLRGAFDRAFTDGDNSAVLPTDTQKNTVLALAAKHSVVPIEAFARVLAERFLSVSDVIAGATIRIGQRRWARADVGGAPHPHTFVMQGDELRFTELDATRDGIRTITSGIENLVVLKTTGSGFTGYLKDEYTTLAETEDRIFATSISARFRYGQPTDDGADFDGTWAAVRQALIETFAEQHSVSVQQTLYDMGKRILAEHDALAEIQLTMPNIHHLPLDLSHFGVAENRDVFLPISEPHGLIEATVRRA